MERRSFLTSLAAPALARAAAPLARSVRITGLETDLLRMPPGKGTMDAIHLLGIDGGGVVLRLLTDSGVTGWAYSSFGMIAGGPAVVQTILEKEVKPVLLGKDPAFPKRLRAELWSALEYHSVLGVAQFAMAAADIAIWDILGKLAGLPVYRMIGAFSERMPVYSMCGWY
ncbi:MAG: mandelate racemase/muconate lactonizing enzyme family protein, partial [Acidobacteria bacterium]|nr:mandelate racemase/muconate lactonizing enzyme family protein [Acidobacteriota bacterium]